jgi:hypothetical protein
MDLTDQTKGDTSEKADWPLDAATEQKAEAAAIAHDQYDPDSIYTGSDNIAIPPPQLKRRLLPGNGRGSVQTRGICSDIQDYRQYRTGWNASAHCCRNK